MLEFNLSDYIKPGDIFVNKITGVKFLVIEKAQDAMNYDGFDIWVLRKTEGGNNQYFTLLKRLFIIIL